MSNYEEQYMKLNVQEQIVSKLLKENEDKLNKESVDLISNLLDEKHDSKLVAMVEFLKGWKSDITKSKEDALKSINLAKEIGEQLR